MERNPSLEGSLSSRYSNDSSPGKERGQRQPKARRGGFGDAGTMGSNGELPVAPIVQVSSERQLSDELQTIITGLEPNLPWDQRVKAMLRLEGLVKGGAAELPVFAELLPSTQACLTAQLQDRRSAISRQACHLISTLVQACGSQAEPLAAGMFPVVFKAQGMSIQIVTESSDACLRTIIQHCPSSRLLPTLCSYVKTSKNVKLRLSAAEYLLLAVREWDAGILDKQAEAVETSIMSASADPTGETREAGRNAFVAYYAKRPAAAQMLLKKLPDTERSLKEKLQTAVKKTLESPDMMMVSDAVVHIVSRPPSQTASLQSSAPSTAGSSPKRALRVPRLTVPSPRPTMTREPSGFLSARGTAPSPSTGLPPRPLSARESPGAAARRVPEFAVPAPLVKKPSARRSLGGGALRIAPPSNTESRYALPSSVPSIPASPDTNRVACPPTIPKKCFASPSVSGALRQPMEIDVEQHRAAPARVALLDTEPEDDFISLSEAVQAFSKSGLDWSGRVALYEEVQFSLDEGNFLSIAAEHEDGSNDLLDKFMRILAEGMGDAHFKVCGAALETLSGVLRSPQFTPTLEAHIETFSPVLFVRLTDPKEQIRQLAGAAANLLPQVLSPDSVMHGLAASLNSAKAPKVLCAVMDFYADLVTVGTQKGRDPADSGAARAMLAGCLPLATHKHQDVRQSALGAVAAVYFAGPQSAAVVRSAIEIMPPKSADAIKRGISQIGGQKSVQPKASREVTMSPSPGPATTPKRPPFELPLPESSEQRPPLSSAQRRLSSPSPVSPLALRECPSSPIDQEMSYEQEENEETDVPQLALPLLNSTFTPPRDLAGTPIPPLSVRALPSPASAHRSLIHGVIADADGDTYMMSKEKESPMDARGNAVSITVDATFNVQSAAAPSPPPSQPPSQPPPPPPTSSTWAPAPVEEIDILIAKLQQSMPSAASMSEALSLAPRLEAADRSKLCNVVQESLLAVLEKGTEARIDVIEAGLTTYAEIASLVVPSSLPALQNSITPAVLKQVLLAQGHEHEAVAFAAEKCAQQIIGNLASTTSLALLVPLLPAVDRRPPFEGDRAVLSLGVLRLLKTILPNVTNSQISDVLSAAMPPSCICYTSANAELRRAAVDFIVSLHLRLGDEVVRPHTEMLSLAQIKLIDIYVERAKRAIQQPPNIVISIS